MPWATETVLLSSRPVSKCVVTSTRQADDEKAVSAGGGAVERPRAINPLPIRGSFSSRQKRRQGISVVDKNQKVPGVSIASY
jgi:hypothetical protein